MLRKILIVMAIGFTLLLAVLAGVAFYLDVPRFVVGIIEYGGQAREGDLVVGDAAPSVTVFALDGESSQPLDSYIGDKPLVLIFGSFT